MPVVRLKESDAGKSKWVFKHRQLHSKKDDSETEEETSGTEDVEGESEETSPTEDTNRGSEDTCGTTVTHGSLEEVQDTELIDIEDITPIVPPKATQPQTHSRKRVGFTAPITFRAPQRQTRQSGPIQGRGPECNKFAAGKCTVHKPKVGPNLVELPKRRNRGNKKPAEARHLSSKLGDRGHTTVAGVTIPGNSGRITRS